MKAWEQKLTVDLLLATQPINQVYVSLTFAFNTAKTTRETVMVFGLLNELVMRESSQVHVTQQPSGTYYVSCPLCVQQSFTRGSNKGRSHPMLATESLVKANDFAADHRVWHLNRLDTLRISAYENSTDD